MTPAELVALIRSSSSSDRALELLAEHDRKLVAMANASEAAAVALARQSRAAEISAGLRAYARESGGVAPSQVSGFILAADVIDSGEV